MTAGPEIDPLTRLAILHGTDKWGTHFYTPHYHALFASFRSRPVRLLEIGIGGYHYASQGGQSLSMWADYFPQGRIVGIDIAHKVLPLNKRIVVLQGSQDDPEFLTRVSREHGPFDIIIDDGSHVPAHVIASFNALFPLLADGGLYIVEDTQTAFWPDFGGERVSGGRLYEWMTEILRGLNHAERAITAPSLPVTPQARSIRSAHVWHNLFVVEKGNNEEPSNFDPGGGNRAYLDYAIGVARTVLAQTPSAAGFAAYADTLRVAGAVEESLAVVVEALEASPTNTTLLLAAARGAQAAGKPGDARGYLQRAAATAPFDQQIMRDLASFQEARSAP